MRALQEADVIIYAGSLVNEELLEYAKKECEIYNSAYMNLDEVIDVIVKAEQAGKKVVRLTGFCRPLLQEARFQWLFRF